MVYLGEKYKGHTDWGRSCSREQCSPPSTLWRDTDTGSAGTRNMADTWRSSGSLDSCPLLDASNQNIRQHMARSRPTDTGTIPQHKNISTSGTSVVIWWVSHSPRHTPLIMIAWRKKKTKPCNQSWMRCYQAATGCLLLMNLDPRWCSAAQLWWYMKCLCPLPSKVRWIWGREGGRIPLKVISRFDKWSWI